MVFGWRGKGVGWLDEGYIDRVRLYDKRRENRLYMIYEGFADNVKVILG